MRRRVRPARRGDSGLCLVTGGAGFIGTNVAARLLDLGRPVRILDNLARAGVDDNLQWLCSTYRDRVEVVRGDIRDRAVVKRAVTDVAEVFHFAAQVAVTTSLVDPGSDFLINAGGTLNLLEELRALAEPPSLVFTSTNKVYGDLEDVELVPDGSRYVPADTETRSWGISEARPIAFHSPYGCSKGAADQYVLDYARTFGLPAVVFRMSCIYGPHQCGNEDQGWVAHFVMRAMQACPVTIYGDGLQVRDILFVDDLVDALLRAQAHIDSLAGEAFNIGGGPPRTTSLVELLDTLTAVNGRETRVDFDAWREADQRYYVSDTRKFEDATGWHARVGVAEGVRALHGWLRDSGCVPLSTATAGAGQRVAS
jgi:CDP-paratose 2-epimerase